MAGGIRDWFGDLEPVKWNSVSASSVVFG
jgi:hypothetical protein